MTKDSQESMFRFHDELPISGDNVKNELGQFVSSLIVLVVKYIFGLVKRKIKICNR